MTTLPSDTAPVICIAAALILDAQGRTLLVRKRGSSFFMQAGGKIEPGEAPLAALARELQEELGVHLPSEVSYLGRFLAEAANEDGHWVDAELYSFRLDRNVSPAAEIEEVIWATEEMLPTIQLAPLTRDEVIPLFCCLRQ
ncbi:NUDIX domain-containing protein [Neorhizobium lilium]|uniref:NUDIX domain-containing protein n=1 Tax=Neorhizobium lilium TaxID=2503024 RepID=A0A444LB09_9HYPH|nr:NUDIX domain-containing protein [Neorhizobium lilium]RWX74777.1 NUDIX domain-containing protein [Neorhizobium lilium]